MGLVNCPKCGGKGLRIVWGMLTEEGHRRYANDPNVVSGGCCIQPGITHQCAVCGFRWAAQDWEDPDYEEDLWIVGELNGDLVLAGTDVPEDDTEVWLQFEPENRMDLAAFDEAQGEGVVGWYAEPEPYDPEIDSPGSPEPVAFGAIGGGVFIGDGDRLAKWSTAVGIQALTVTPSQYMKFNGGYMVDPDPAAAAAAVAAYKAHTPSFEDSEIIPNLTDPDVLDMSGPHRRGGPNAEPNSELDCFVVGRCKTTELDGWRRSVLPSAPRKFYAQNDDEYRHEEVVAIAVGRWLRHARKRTTRGGDGFAARLALSPPAGDNWCVLRKGPSNVKIVRGMASIDMTDRARVPLVFDPEPILEALRNR